MDRRGGEREPEQAQNRAHSPQGALPNVVLTPGRRCHPEGAPACKPLVHSPLGATEGSTVRYLRPYMVSGLQSAVWTVAKYVRAPGSAALFPKKLTSRETHLHPSREQRCVSG